MENKTNLKLNILEPRATEKTYTEQTKRIYVFPVDKNMSKQAIARLVAEEFKVTVTEVKTLTRKGKKTKFNRGKHAYPGTTYRQDKKYAYVKLKEGDSIKVFEDAEEDTKKTNKASAKEAKLAEKEAKKAEKEATKADKNAGKENK